MTTPTAPRLLNEVEAAALLAVREPTLRRWRWSGDGPKFVKVGRCVRYHPADIDAFIDAGRRSSTSETPPGQS